MSKFINLPYEIVKKYHFPLWQCQRCGNYFDTEENCPICKGGRIPPDLDSYVHKILMPTLNQVEREELSKYFTQYVTSGWENSGGTDITDSSAWSGYFGVTPTITSSPNVHHGSYAMQIYIGGGSNGGCVTADVDLSDAYLRAYVKWDLDIGNYEAISLIEFWNSAIFRIASLSLYNNATDKVWRLGFQNSGYDNANSAYLKNPVKNSYYCIELRAKPGQGDGTYQVWINAVQLSDVALFSAYSVTSMVTNEYLGAVWADTSGIKITVDCAILADAYIGEEASEVAKDYTDNGSGTDSLLLENLVTYTDTGSGVEIALDVQGEIAVYDMSTLTTEDWTKDWTEFLYGDYGYEQEELLTVEKWTDSASELWLYIEDFGAFKMRWLDAGAGEDDWVSTTPQLFDWGTALEQVNISMEVLASETGVGSDLITSAGVEGELITIEGQISPTELMTGVEVPGLTTDNYMSDIGVGIEVVTPMLEILMTDEGAGSELWGEPFESVLINISDSGLGEDILAEFDRGFIDSGSGLEALSELDRSILDIGIGLDTLPAFEKGILDSGLGEELFSGESIQEIMSDIGLGDEISMIEATLGLSDLGTGLETSYSLETDVPIPDEGLGIDSIILESEYLFLDSGLGSDLINISMEGLPFIGDSGSGVESLLETSADIPLLDLGLGNDLITIEQPDLILSDDAIGLDIIALESTVGLTDLGSGLESLIELSSELSLVDANSLVEETFIGEAEILITDVGVGEDLLPGFDKIFIDSMIGMDKIGLDRIFPDTGLGAEVIDINKAPVIDIIINSELSIVERPIEIDSTSEPFSQEVDIVERTIVIEVLPE